MKKYLSKVDPQAYKLLKAEEKRQASTLMMIPSENHSSEAVREVVGSCLQDKYCEGYPYKRYYQGQENFDKLEALCQERAKKLFGVPYVNAQALSGSPANLAVYYALLEPGDKIMGQALDQGGHLSHGSPVNFSGRLFQSVSYGLNKDGLIDYQAIDALAQKERPKIIIAGVSAYPLALDFARFCQIADNCGAYLLADIAHVAGLVLAGVYLNPVPYCHIITTTTHKTLRGPRGALIMATSRGLEKDPDLGKKIDTAVFPGLQGGPHQNNIAGIAVALAEAASPSFIEYGKQIVKNAKALAQELKKQRFQLVAGSTNTHLILIDLRNFAVLGNTAAEALEAAGIITNRNSIPFDPNPPFYPSGLRLGTPGVTSRGMGQKQMKQIAWCMTRVIKSVSTVKEQKQISFEQEKKKQTRKEIIAQTQEIKKVRAEIAQLCQKFPLKQTY